MQIGRLYLDHPTTALVVHSLCAAALGFISSTIQKQWVAEDFTLVHISVWWVGLLLLLLWAGERRPRRRPDEAMPAGPLPHGCRRQVVFRASQPWFHEIRSEEICPDLPPGGPLFRWICLRLPGPWSVHTFTMSLRECTQRATIDRSGRHVFVIDFHSVDGMWLLSVSSFAGATPAEVRQFLLALHQALVSTDGVSEVRWYPDDALEDRLIDEVEQGRGRDMPVDEDNPA